NGVVAHASAFNAASGAERTFETITPTLRAMRSDGDGRADVATLSLGLRLPPGIDVDALLTALHELAGSAALTVEGIQEGWRSDKRTPLAAPFLRGIRAAGGQPRFTVKLGTSDMTVVGPVWRCPIVAYGPGDASLDHTPEERIDLADYGRAIRVLADVLEAL
ncbi:MAG: M20/M25/M40 family metallo-hydrolase, partial [Thermomicrobiales bacterium]|nr:M20/M25/M40 family metallo-hydrolase [Thermomicrobiales bacterium]